MAGNSSHDTPLPLVMDDDHDGDTTWGQVGPPPTWPSGDSSDQGSDGSGSFKNWEPDHDYMSNSSDYYEWGPPSSSTGPSLDPGPSLGDLLSGPGWHETSTETGQELKNWSWKQAGLEDETSTEISYDPTNRRHILPPKRLPDIPQDVTAVIEQLVALELGGPDQKERLAILWSELLSHREKLVFPVEAYLWILHKIDPRGDGTRPMSLQSPLLAGPVFENVEEATVAYFLDILADAPAYSMRVGAVGFLIRDCSEPVLVVGSENFLEDRVVEFYENLWGKIQALASFYDEVGGGGDSPQFTPEQSMQLGLQMKDLLEFFVAEDTERLRVAIEDFLRRYKKLSQRKEEKNQWESAEAGKAVLSIISTLESVASELEFCEPENLSNPRERVRKIADLLQDELNAIYAGIPRTSDSKPGRIMLKHVEEEFNRHGTYSDFAMYFKAVFAPVLHARMIKILVSNPARRAKLLVKNPITVERVIPQARVVSGMTRRQALTLIAFLSSSRIKRPLACQSTARLLARVGYNPGAETWLVPGECLVHREIQNIIAEKPLTTIPYPYIGTPLGLQQPSALSAAYFKAESACPKTPKIQMRRCEGVFPWKAAIPFLGKSLDEKMGSEISYWVGQDICNKVWCYDDYDAKRR